MIKVDLINFFIIIAMVTIGRFIANALAAVTAHSPIGKALSIIAA